MPKPAKFRLLGTALALSFTVLALACFKFQHAPGQAFVASPLQLLPGQQVHHHIYQDAEADHYSCDFSFMPGAWTGRKASSRDAAQTVQGSVAHRANALHKAASRDTRSVHHGSGRPLYGTAEAQAIIWAHQHPQDCRSQRFLLHSPQVEAGIGSQLHVLGLALGVAMDTNRVLLLNTDVRHALYTDDPYCGPDRPNLDDCYFERLTNCTLADVALSANSTDATARLIDIRDGELADLKVVVNDQLHSTPARAAARGAALGNVTYAWVPKRLQRLVERSPVAPHKRFYWYRAQASMFIVRPNTRTRANLARLRQQTLENPLPSYASAISVHVRHGDKWMEAAEQPAHAYLETATALHSKVKGALHRELLLSMEDPSVVAWFAQNVTRWHVSHTRSIRKPDRQRSTWDYARERGFAAEYLDGLLNLELALECGGWIGTLSSNWCRLIDELRSTVRCKADGMYLDAAQGDPPENIGWRR